MPHTKRQNQKTIRTTVGELAAAAHPLLEPCRGVECRHLIAQAVARVERRSSRKMELERRPSEAPCRARRPVPAPGFHPPNASNVHGSASTKTPAPWASAVSIIGCTLPNPR